MTLLSVIMARYEVDRAFILFCLFGSILFEAGCVYGTKTEDGDEKHEISKRNGDYNPSPLPGYLAYSHQPSYYPVSYCPHENPATQPPECDSNDEPLSSVPSQRKNCTCTWTNTSAGCTIRLCTPADICGVGAGLCHDFKCICNGLNASPDYCVEILPYPETAVVPYTPTPAGGFMTNTNQFFSHAHTHQISNLNTQQATIKEAQKQLLLEALVQAPSFFDNA